MNSMSKRRFFKAFISLQFNDRAPCNDEKNCLSFWDMNTVNYLIASDSQSYLQ